MRTADVLGNCMLAICPDKVPKRGESAHNARWQVHKVAILWAEVFGNILSLYSSNGARHVPFLAVCRSVIHVMVRLPRES